MWASHLLAAVDLLSRSEAPSLRTVGSIDLCPPICSTPRSTEARLQSPVTIGAAAFLSLGASCPCHRGSGPTVTATRILTIRPNPLPTAARCCRSSECSARCPSPHRDSPILPTCEAPASLSPPRGEVWGRLGPRWCARSMLFPLAGTDKPSKDRLVAV
ncbi:hypothetical protein LXA43DRAFT_721612 [Ganoderma leucocontextum]|nr:hypothetical protein LXA43DRAFT_721612 [Ganoderma leucocontextum]